MTATYDITVRKGNTGIVGNPDGLCLILKDETTGEARDLTGFNYRFRAYWFDAIQISKTSEGGGDITVNASTGEVSVPLSVENNAAFPLNVIITYELEEYTGATQQTILAGRVLVKKGVDNV